jgi:putative ABC transport system permease protein
VQLRHIAFDSVRRRKGRFVFVLGAITLGIGTIVGLVSLTRTMQAEVSDELDRFGANIVVTPKSDMLDLSYGGLAVAGLEVSREELRLDDAAAIRTIHHRRNISVVSPKLVGVVQVAGTRVLLVGTDVSQEPGLKPWWEMQSGERAAPPGTVIVGSEVAEALRLDAGDTLALHDSTVRVAGVLRPTGSIDDRAVFCDLILAQRALGRPNAISLIEVAALCRGCPIEDIVSQIAAALPHARVVPVRQAVAARERAVGQLTRFSYAISVLLVLVATLVVMSTMMAAVTERTREIGILRAVGFRRTQVAAVILIETLAVTASGGIAGWATGVLAARSVGPALAQITTPVVLDSSLGALAVGFAVVIGIAGGAYPAIRAAKMDPALALRHM